MTTETVTGDHLESTLDQIIRDLDTPFDVLPEEAIRAAQRHRDQIVPRLIQTIHDATARAAAGDVPKGNLHFLALFLLTEFRAKEALSAIVEAVSLPGELPFDLFGDAVTESLRHTFATLAGDQVELLDGLIGDRALNAYVRIEAASAYLYLVRDGLMTRDAAVAMLRKHLQKADEDEDYDFVSLLVTTLLDYGPHEAREDIEGAFRRDLVDEDCINREYAMQCIDDGDAEFQAALDRSGPTGIDDTFEELKRWAVFRPRDERVDFGDEDEDDLGSELRFFDDEGLEDDDSEYDFDALDKPAAIGSVRPIRNEQPKVGRNDPCPCGSGKKFKKCCGAH